MLKKLLAALISTLYSPFVAKSTNGQAGMTFAGAVPATGSLVNAMNMLSVASMYAGGTPNFASVAGTTETLTNLGNLTRFYSAGSAVTVTLDYAYNIVAALPGYSQSVANGLSSGLLNSVFQGQLFSFTVVTAASTTVATPTRSDTAVTLAGTTSIAASTARFYQGQITQLTTTTAFVPDSGTTFTSIAQVGTTNAYTVTLGVNATSPVVGNVIFLGVTAGTLPAGFYPIAKVTSATSFVIVAPPASTAWTATATTFGTSNSTGSAGAIYSPLVTITGMWAVATATA